MGRTINVKIDGQWVPLSISNNQTIEIDKTLTIENKAADAKAVGDKFVEVNTSLDKKYEKPDGGITEDDLSIDIINKLNFYGGGSSGSASQYPGCVYVDDYKVNGASDIKAINDAIAAATASQYYSKMIVFTSRQYTITEPILLKSQLKFVGSSKGLTDNGTAIVNGSSNMFAYGDATDLNGIVFDGIVFCGNQTNHNTCCFPALPSGKTLNFRGLTIKNGGFKWFKQVFEYPELLGETSAPSISMTICNLSHLQFTKCETIGSISGSDNTFYDWNAGDGSLSDVDVLFDARCELSRFDNLFFTGKLKGTYGAKCIMQLRGATNVVSNCWFDYSDQAGLRITGGNAHNNTVTNCMFRGNSRVSGADIEFVANGDFSPCDNIITGNTFVRKYHTSSADQGNIRISIPAKCKRNTISRNAYDIDGGVVFEITNSEATTIIDEPAYGITHGGSGSSGSTELIIDGNALDMALQTVFNEGGNA